MVISIGKLTSVLQDLELIGKYVDCKRMEFQFGRLHAKWGANIPGVSHTFLWLHDLLTVVSDSVHICFPT
jgi:hypothetical protein